MRPARERTPVLCVESDDSAHDRVLVHGPHRCSASMTILAFLETCTVGSNTVVLTDRLTWPIVVRSHRPARSTRQKM
jgi:hypothetical protein